MNRSVRPARVRRATHAQRGQMIPILAFGIVAVLGIAALGVDVGIWRYQQRLEQSAADAAAVAGAIRLYYPTTAATPAPVEVTSAARAAARTNGFADDGGVGTTVVAVNAPPTTNTPPYPSATPYASAVEVIVTKKQPTYFAGIFGRQTQTISARAVAARVTDHTPACLTQLDPLGGLVFSAGNIATTDCAVELDGTAAVPGGIIAPTVTYHGLPPVAPIAYGGRTVTPTYSSTSVGDPCLKIQGCAYLANTAIPPLTSSATDASKAATLTAPSPPGYLVVKNCCAKSLQFNPGLYYIYGGISGPISGTGVTLVNVDGAATFGGGSVSVTAPATFGAPDNAPTAGVAFYQPSGNHNPIVYHGTSVDVFGLFYAPSATVTSDGKGDTYSNIVVGGYEVHGNKTLTIDPYSSPTSGVTSAELPTHVALTE